MKIKNLTKKYGWNIKLAIILILTSVVLYTAQTTIFHQPMTELFYIGIDLVFLPIEVLLVVIIIQTAISQREKNILLDKLNMVIGAFFSEVGTDLLSEISKFDAKSSKTSRLLIINSKWADQDFVHAKKNINSINYSLKISKGNTDSMEFLKEAKIFLQSNRKFLLALLENPNLLEHETFTELLRSVFHLTEELDKRENMYNLPKSDYDHLRKDVERVYNLLINEWLDYTEHLKNNYPYLFSLAMRTNPFDPNKSIEIKDEYNE
jgi:hypothetical protein